MKDKIILSIMYIFSFIPMLFNQYGFGVGITEIKGIINIANPIGFLLIILFFIGVWNTNGNHKLNKILTLIGTIGIVFCEIYFLFTWNYPNTTFKGHLLNFWKMTFPAYYIGLFVSLIMVLINVYFI